MTATQSTVVHPNAVETLRQRFRGALLRQGEEGYDEARRIWNGAIDRYPALIARCAGADDVVTAMRFAREWDMLVSVRGGGHAVAGHAVCDGGMMIDLSLMKAIRVDPVARRELWDLLFQLAGQGITLLITTHYMDEAERCGRVGYLHLSKLLVVGTPAELKKLPEVTPAGWRRVEIVAPDTAELLMALKHRPTVREATIFGQSIHALVEDSDDLADIARHEVTIRPAAPNLEDVFVTIAKKRQRELADAA